MGDTYFGVQCLIYGSSISVRDNRFVSLKNIVSGFKALFLSSDTEFQDIAYKDMSDDYKNLLTFLELQNKLVS